jgi:hypothetical protein
VAFFISLNAPFRATTFPDRTPISHCDQAVLHAIGNVSEHTKVVIMDMAVQDIAINMDFIQCAADFFDQTV